MSSTTTNVRGPSAKFDKLAFIKYMKNIGSAYRNQARELVSICRTLVQAQAQTAGTGAKLRNALECVDDALSSATTVGTKASKEVDGKLEEAINALCHYEMDCHRKDPVSDDSRDMAIRKRMATAKAKDQSSSSILNALKEKLRSKPTPDGWSKPTNVVEFVLFKSLPDSSPIIVPQVLGNGANVAEVLWNFSRCKGDKRITLKQNPHFYKPLPESNEEYGNDFRSDPMESFVETPKVHVLTDRPGRVYLGSGQDIRAFGNIWRPKDAIIFKDVCGKLEGESVVGASIQGNSNLRYRVEPMQPSTSTNSVAWEPLHDWREPIRRVLDSNDTMSIHISAEQSQSSKSRRISPSISGNSSLGSLNSSSTKHISSNNALSSSIPYPQHRVATMETPSSRVTSQSSSLSEQPLTTSARMDLATMGNALMIETGILSSRATSLSSSFSQLSLTTTVSTDATTLGDVPAVATRIPSSCGTSMSAAPSQASLATSLSTNPATPAPEPIPAMLIPSSDRISQSASPSRPMLTGPVSTDPTTSAEAPIASSQYSPNSHPSPTVPLSTDTVTPAQAPIVAIRISSSHGISQSQSSSQPSLTTPPSTDPAAAPAYAPIAAAGIPSSHGTSQSASPSQALPATLPSTELATLAHCPVVSTLNHGTPWSGSIAQASLITSLSKDSPPPEQAPSNAAPLEVIPDVSRKRDLEGSISTLNMTITLPSETSSNNTLAGGRDARSGGDGRGQANAASLNLGGATTTTLKRDTKPVPLQAQGKPSVQPQTAGWQLWFQGSVWRR